VKVLFVGDGPHDVGRDAESQGERFEGVVQILARRLCPHIAADSPHDETHAPTGVSARRSYLRALQCPAGR